MFDYTIGPYRIRSFIFDHFALDGGAMFGPLPKMLWNKRIAANAENRIPMVSRSLFIEGEGKKILVDCGCGDKWDEKFRDIYCIRHETQTLFRFDEITHVILSHLHFDHAAGLSYIDKAGALSLRYPAAEHIVQKSNYALAQAPNIREKASYLPEHVAPLGKAKLRLIDGDEEILPGVFVQCLNGHTQGMQIVHVKDSASGAHLVFVSDLIPTQHHLPVHYHMGYDMCAKTVLEEKEKFYASCISDKSILVFQHDAEREAGIFQVDAHGKITLA